MASINDEEVILHAVALSTLEKAIKAIGYCFPCCGWNTVPYNHEQIIFYFGKYTETQSPGLQYNPCCGVNAVLVNTSLQMFESPVIQCFDINNVHIDVRAVVRYEITNTQQFIRASNSNMNIVRFLTETTVKKVFSKHSYTENVCVEIQTLLQNNLNDNGITIKSASIADINVPNKMAELMFKEKVAEYDAKARNILTNNTCVVINTIVREIGENMDKHELDVMKRNLAVVLMNENGTVLMNETGANAVLPK